MFPDALQHIDEYLFHLINSTWSNPFFDVVMPPLREKLFWVPLYLVMAIFLGITFKKKGAVMILVLLLNFAASDQLSSAVIKPAVGRLRPCNDPDFREEVQLRIEACGAGKSFTSSHATNTFAFAVMCILILGKRWRFTLPVALLWATAISYAQVYVGVHYPLDIIGGALLGTFISIILFNIAQKFIPGGIRA